MRQPNPPDRLWAGVFFTFLLSIVVSILAFLVGGLLNSLPLILVPFVIGLAQLLYVVPMVIWSIRQRRWEFMKGVIIAAVVTALLNGSCWLLVSNSYS